MVRPVGVVFGKARQGKEIAARSSEVGRVLVEFGVSRLGFSGVVERGEFGLAVVGSGYVRRGSFGAVMCGVVEFGVSRLGFRGGVL